MIVKKVLLQSYEFNLQYAGRLVDDVTDEMMTQTPASGLENHPAFTIGHLVSGAAMTARYLGGPYKLNHHWEELFRRKGPGDPRRPNPEGNRYPSKEELMIALTEQHALVSKLITDLHDSRFEEPAVWRFQDHMPTLGGLVWFMCITHEAMHLGQLAAWRRAMELPYALAKL